MANDSCSRLSDAGRSRKRTSLPTSVGGGVAASAPTIRSTVALFVGFGDQQQKMHAAFIFKWHPRPRSHVNIIASTLMTMPTAATVPTIRPVFSLLAMTTSCPPKGETRRGWLTRSNRTDHRERRSPSRRQS